MVDPWKLYKIRSILEILNLMKLGGLNGVAENGDVEGDGQMADREKEEQLRKGTRYFYLH